MSDREGRRADLMKGSKSELAEMVRSTYRASIRPSLAYLMSTYDKSALAERLLRVQDDFIEQQED